MDEIRFDPQTGQPVQPQYAVMRKTFSATAKERLLALLSYPAAFLYVCAILAEGKTIRILFAVFTLVFCLGVEYAHRTVRAGWERWVWLGCMALCIIYPLWGGDEVWDGWSSLFAHGFAIYYVLCRANVLLEGRTSHLLPLDALWGAVVFPFSRFQIMPY